MPSTRSAISRVKSETVELPALNILSSAATEAERIRYVVRHIKAMTLCGRKTLQFAWLVGRELVYLKEARPDLCGRAWDRFLKRNIGIGERQAYDIMRVHRAYPTVRSLPEDIYSVRGAIEHLKTQKDIGKAEGRAANGGAGSGSAVGHSCSSSTEVQVHPAQIGLPSSARTRAELRAVHQQIAEIALMDAAAFKKVRDFIRKQHEIATRKARRSRPR